MPKYDDINPKSTTVSPYWQSHAAVRKRAAKHLLALREALTSGQGAPPPRAGDTLVLGTWNLREFDSGSWGERLPESLTYIAEIIDRFDLVAIQEVRADLRALKDLQYRLGPNWSYLVSDVTRGTAGNQERLAYLYDTRKVRFLGIAGELVLPPVKAPKGGGARAQGDPGPADRAHTADGRLPGRVDQVRARHGPHPLWGGLSGAGGSNRGDQAVRHLPAGANRRPHRRDPQLHRARGLQHLQNEDKTMKALTEEGGFTIPTAEGPPRDERRQEQEVRPDRLPRAGRSLLSTGKAGAFDFYEHVFTNDEADSYRPQIDEYIKAQHDAGKKTPKFPTTTRPR